VLDDAPAAETPALPDAPEAPAPAVHRAEAPTAPAPVVTAAAAVAVAVAEPAAATVAEAPEPVREPDAPQPIAPAAPAPSAPVARTEAAAAPRPVAPPRVHTPIVTAVLPLISRGDGSHQLSVRLHPAELGAIDLDVELRSGEINLRMRTETDAGREAIRAALPMLRSELEAAGVRAGTFDLGDRQSGQMPNQQHQSGTSGSSFAASGAIADEAPIEDDVDPDAAVDVRV
jgi:flagellar hook-length control protein FliK